MKCFSLNRLFELQQVASNGYDIHYPLFNFSAHIASLIMFIIRLVDKKMLLFYGDGTLFT